MDGNSCSPPYIRKKYFEFFFVLESYASKNSAKRGKHKWLIIYTLSISVLVLSVVLYACFSSSRPLGPQKGTRAKSLQNMELYSRDNKMMKQEEEISERQERIGECISRVQVSTQINTCKM